MSLQSRLDYWRAQRAAVMSYLMDASPWLQPVLQEDLREIDRFIAHYEARLMRRPSTPEQTDGGERSTDGGSPAPAGS